MDSVLPFNTLTVALSGLGVIGTTFVRHYFKRKEVTKQQEVRNSLLFDEAFSVLRKFFMKSALHTVEETQTFGNNYVPAPFWVRVIRIVVPLSSRLEAGKVIISTLGEEEIKNVVGGREWWQRTAHKEAGLDGEWISMKRDWQGLEKEAKEREKRDKANGEKAPKKDHLNELRREKTRELQDMAKEDAKRRRKVGKEADGRLDPSTPKEATTETDLEDADSDTESIAQRKAAERQRRAFEGDDEASTPYHEDDSYSPELDDMPLCLYLWGGAYFFGSINTHRYVMWRIARKMGGRVFSVKYRLAPQFPFPCALQDALSAYLYLIRPPPGAKHRPVDPSKIVIAGDSAGGGLSLALLCMIRDAGLPAPAGGILLSPWCDLTHSFPSILQNTETDIPPPYGFSLFKPSTLWPPPPPEFRKRAANSTSIDGLKAAAKAFTSSHGHSSSAPAGSSDNATPASTRRHAHLGRAAEKKGLELASAVEKLPESDPQQAEQHETKGGTTGGSNEGKGEIGAVIKVKIDGEEVELADQIQLYATNDQLVHPFVSPAFAPSLGGLPPLYVMCGDKEVLRDEAIFMAHRAAHPDKYPVRKGILEANPGRTEKGKSYPPTKVHLQIYDDACHDLPLFSFTDTAKYCYRAIASFALFVTQTNEKDQQLPFSAEPSSIDDSNGFLAPPQSNPALNPPKQRSASLFSSHSRSVPARSSTAPTSRSSSTSSKARRISNIDQTIYTGTQPFNRPEYVDNMIRERISITGIVRPMEREEEMQALTLDPEDLGLIKEGPVKRYLAGKVIWDKKFAREQRSVNKNREKHLHKSVKEEAKRITRRAEEAAKRKKTDLMDSRSKKHQQPLAPDGPDQRVTDSPEPMDHVDEEAEETGGIWDLHGENPPPSSIAARKDTSEARKLAKTLEEHYSRLHALALWSEIHDVVGHAPREDSTSSNGRGERSHHPASASIAGGLSSIEHADYPRTSPRQ
ncbi:uncharacterized protein JCM6883_006308 [Sporobolomyces salmoneus]|uniref:uncharacterized protein n=1 Tax=Sporobolomyces salmoneus TaxID=183962 RepID=UPI0031740452